MMECSVRFVYETVIKEGRTVQIAGLKPALCLRGQKHALAVINDDLWVRTIELDLHDHDKAGPVLYHGEPYDPKAFADRFLMSAKSAGKPITRRAKHLLTVRDEADENNLPEEILEREPVQQERVYAENTPKERQKAAQKPGPVKDVTGEYEGKLMAVPGAKDDSLTPGEDSSSEPSPKPRKPDRRDLRNAVKKAHETARKAIAPRVETTRTIRAGATAPNPPVKKTGNGAERGILIKKLAAEMKIDPFDLRVLIRSTGMRAPYDDEKKVREAIKRAKSALITVGASKKRKDNPPMKRAK